MSTLKELSGPAGERAWESDRGSLRIRRPKPNVVVFVERGYLDDEFVPKLVEAMDDAAATASDLEFFVDAYELEGYTPAVRISSTNWLKANRPKVHRQHMLVASKLTKMGLSVASLVLGGVLVGHDSRNTFDAALRRATRSGTSEVSERR